MPPPVKEFYNKTRTIRQKLLREGRNLMGTQAYQQADEAGKRAMLAAAQTSAMDEYSNLGKHPDQYIPDPNLFRARDYRLVGAFAPFRLTLSDINGHAKLVPRDDAGAGVGTGVGAGAVAGDGPGGGAGARDDNGMSSSNAGLGGVA